MICKNCGDICHDNDIFCLNCGYLLKDYENIKIPNVDYSLEGNELLNQIDDEFSKTTEEYGNKLSNFSNQLDIYSERIDATTNSFSDGLISLEEHIGNISDCLLDCQDYLKI